MPEERVFTELARGRAEKLYIVMRRMLVEVLPPNTDVRHIGATAVPGCWTKGDLDILIRLPVERFAAADAMLESKFDRNVGSVRAATFSAFEDASHDPHVGLQLTAIDGPYDFFHLFVEALRSSPRLVREYNELKRAHHGVDMNVYRSAKDVFVERVLRNFTPGRC